VIKEYASALCRNKAISWVLIFSAVAFSGSLYAQDTINSAKNWTFNTRLSLSSISDVSAPKGYTVFSSFAVNAGIRYNFFDPVAAELIVSSESREIDFTDIDSKEISLGSIDYLSFVLLLQYHLKFKGNIHPYLGLGVNFNRYFEKSGIINELGVPNSLGLSAQVGIDVDIMPNTVLNLDLRVNQMETKLESIDETAVLLKINPAYLSLGMGFGF
jgi:outer membrane protein